MKITYLGHSCFRLEYKGYSLITDPYQNGKVPGLASLNEQADIVLCSHGHHDHNAEDLIKLTGRMDAPFDITFFDTYHDDAKGTKRGMNKVHIIRADNLKVVHMGDIGCALTPEQINIISGADVLMIPVGGFYTIDALQALEMTKQIAPKTVIPMHYRSGDVGFNEISTVDGFINGFDKDDILYTQSEYMLNNDKVVVMTPKCKG